MILITGGTGYIEGHRGQTRDARARPARFPGFTAIRL